MSTLIKFILGGAALFFALGGPRMFKKKPPAPTRPPVTDVTRPDTPTGDKKAARRSASKDRGSVPGQAIVLENRASALNWLRNNLDELKGMPKKVSLTYYLIAKSERCAPEALSACIQEKIRTQKIDAREFQYTFFLDRVMMAGSGRLKFDGKEYFTNYALLRDAGWNKGKYAGRNSYTSCKAFSWKSKNGLDFIKKNISNEAVFIPIEKAPAPNGLTASGQPAIDWVTVSVNPADFPLSVPNTARRKQLAQRYGKAGKMKPKARSYIVLITESGEMFLTEAMDTGGGVKKGWIDWRISNTSGDIARFHKLGKTATAFCFTTDDPGMTREKIIAKITGGITKK
ncbi:MAG TPA: hypothetical protein ENJ29_04495 [Bacteroidetes bacterium]|nr:hypothetical protein [Bacteroidota bacterium]